jgi:hypothetical protein
MIYDFARVTILFWDVRSGDEITDISMSFRQWLRDPNTLKPM